MAGCDPVNLRLQEMPRPSLNTSNLYVTPFNRYRKKNNKSIFRYLPYRNALRESYKYISIDSLHSIILSDISIMASTKPQVQLIPWDFTSPEHAERLLQQRIVCGWDYAAVESWKPKQEAGNFNLQWIVSSHPHFNPYSTHTSRSSPTPTQKKILKCSNIPQHTPRKHHPFSTPRPPLAVNHAPFLNHSVPSLQSATSVSGSCHLNMKTLTPRSRKARTGSLISMFREHCSSVDWAGRRWIRWSILLRQSR